jgi:LacI family transcriptional regulator
LATIHDVARAAGVSAGTVSRFISGNGYVGEQSKLRIQIAIAELNYSPSSIARSLKVKRTKLLGVVVSDLMNPFVPEVARGIQDRADEAGYCAVIYNTDGHGQREVRALKLLKDRQVDGFIVMPPESEEGNQTILDLHSQGVPVVLLGRNIVPPVIDRVTTDTYLGAIAAVRHLAGLGHRRIAYFGGDSSRQIAAGRRQGYLSGLTQAGLRHDKTLMIDTSLTREGGISAMARLLELPQPTTAIFAVNDTVALGAIQEANRQGLAVPGDISIVGFDDIALAAFALPALTTNAQPKLIMGRIAVDLLLSRIERKNVEGPREVRLPCELLVRGSTAEPRQDAATNQAG